MTTKSHKTLTGNQLHEPKGADAAAIDKVYVSDGAGSGAWAKLTASQLQTTGNSFGAQLFHIQEQQSSGTAGGTFTSGAWQTRLLNTSVTNEITSASLASNQVTLPAGTYWIEAAAMAYNVSLHKVKWYNVTDGSDTLFGFSAYDLNGSGGSQMGKSSVRGRFTIAGAKVFELRHKCSATATTNGFGLPSSLGTEIYSEVMIWKVL